MSHLHRPTAIVLRVLLNRYNKRVLYISHGYKFPSNYALRKPSPSGENARTQVSSRRVCKQTLVTDEGLNSLCHKPLTTAARSRLASARSRSGSDNTLCCHSRPSRRFATPGRSLSFVPWRLTAKLKFTNKNRATRSGCSILIYLY